MIAKKRLASIKQKKGGRELLLPRAPPGHQQLGTPRPTHLLQQQRRSAAARRFFAAAALGGIVAPAVAKQPLAVTGALVARARECSASGS